MDIIVLRMKGYFKTGVGSSESGAKAKVFNNIIKQLMGHYKDLLAYQKGYDIAMKIFILSKKFPSEENTHLPIR